MTKLIKTFKNELISNFIKTLETKTYLKKGRRWQN